MSKIRSFSTNYMLMRWNYFTFRDRLSIWINDAIIHPTHQRALNSLQTVLIGACHYVAVRPVPIVPAQCFFLLWKRLVLPTCTLHVACSRDTSFQVSHVTRDSNVCRLRGGFTAGGGGVRSRVSQGVLGWPPPSLQGPWSLWMPKSLLGPTESESWEAKSESWETETSSSSFTKQIFMCF